MRFMGRPECIEKLGFSAGQVKKLLQEFMLLEMCSLNCDFSSAIVIRLHPDTSRHFSDSEKTLQEVESLGMTFFVAVRGTSTV